MMPGLKAESKSRVDDHAIIFKLLCDSDLIARNHLSKLLWATKFGIEYCFIT